MNYIVKISGEFEKGDCYSCPLSHESYDIDGERVPACAPFERSATCPLEAVAENETIGEQTGWIPTSERLPENEQIALIMCKRKFVWSANGIKEYSFIAMAFYTDGKHNTEESDYSWCDCYENKDFIYDEETEAYIIPEGWWERVRFNDEFNAVDCEVVAWMPLPEPYKKGGK